MVPDILKTLDAAVLRGGASGFDAHVTVGVEVAPDRVVWWVAQLGAHPKTVLTGEIPVEVDAGLVMGLEEAERLMAKDRQPLEQIATWGDREKLDQLIARYFRQGSMLSARAPKTKKAKANKKRKMPL